MKIHIISASPRLNSGFSVVAINVAKGLKKLGHEISYSGLQTSNASEWNQGIEILPTQVGFVDDITQTMLTIGKIKPDVVLAIIQMDADYNGFARLFHKTVVYCPVEGKNIPSGMTGDLLQIKKNGGQVVAQTMYGQEEMRLAFATVPYIYHGFDDKIFKPIDLNKKDEMTYCYYNTGVGRANTDPVMLHKMGCYDCHINEDPLVGKECQYYKEEIVSILKFVDGKWGEIDMPITRLSEITKGKTTYLFVGQNLGVRKRIERLLKAYSIFIGQSRQYKDRTIMHLHCMPISISGVNLIKIVQDLGLQNNVIFSYGTYRSSGWSDESMSILYNTADINVSASSSEGFCIPVLEGFAVGIPMIAPNCSSFTELIGDGEKDPNARGLLASIGEWQMIENCSERAIVNEQHLALMMKKLHTDEKLRERFGKNAIKFANQYTWKNICQQWNDLLKGMK